MKIVIKTLQGKQLPIEVEETFTVSMRNEVLGEANQGKDWGRAQDASWSAEANCLWQSSRGRKQNSQRLLYQGGRLPGCYGVEGKQKLHELYSLNQLQSRQRSRHLFSQFLKRCLSNLCLSQFLSQLLHLSSSRLLHRLNHLLQLEVCRPKSKLLSMI